MRRARRSPRPARAGAARGSAAEAFYRDLFRIRLVEEEVARIYPTDKIKSPVHLSIGQEAVSVGVCRALRPTDAVFGTYRGHALYLAKGGDLRAMLAELHGKETGCAKGKGGSMHLVDPDAGLIGTSAVVGTTIPHAVGFAFAQKTRKTGAVVASFFGDGAVDEGVWHESMNFAALKRLPVLFVCENNFYAIHTRHLARRRLDNIVAQARTYGMPAERVAGGDVFRIHARARRAVDRIRRGGGPAFLEVLTYRWKQHVGPSDDWALGYRSEKEAAPWIRNDAVRRVGRLLPPASRARIEAEIGAEVRDAFAFAERSPFPAAGALLEDVFAEA